MMLLIILGPPGAGKGTQAERLVKDFGLTYVSTGDILRKAVKEKTDMGKKAKTYMDQGKLVPDEVVVKIVRERLQEPDCFAGALLDGFPRTVTQASFLDQSLPEINIAIDLVITIQVDEEELVERLTGRRVCSDCGANYHIKYMPPAVRNVCDQCCGTLYLRDDDTFETVKERLSVYKEQTEPLIAFYRERKLISLIDGNQEIDQVYEHIKAVISKL